MCKFCERGEVVSSKSNRPRVSVRLVWSQGCWKMHFEEELEEVYKSWFNLDVAYCPECGRALAEGRK